MNPRKLMTVAFCAAACVTTTAFAEDDFGIESATPTAIADPVNPQPGMTANAYHFDWGNDLNKYRTMTSSMESVKRLPAVATFVDKEDSFSRAVVPEQQDVHTMMWDGFIKCKRAATYTFTFSNYDAYSFFVNGVKYVNNCFRQESRDIDLKVGWNHVAIVAYFNHRDNKLSINYKPKGSLSEPRPIAPKDLFHDEKPEEEW